MKIKCPKCESSHPLGPERLKDNLLSYRCAPCGGNYLSSKNYLKWKRTAGASVLPEEETIDTILVADDAYDALICPECQRIMIKYDVGHGIRFKIDFCRSCNGVWLDKNEWEILESKNLHEEINFVFTEGWQNKIRRLETHAKLEDLFRAKIGEKNFRVVGEFKEWLSSNEFKTEIVAHLQKVLISNESHEAMDR